MGSISVVVATLDDRETLRDCIDGVLAGGVAVGEVLVVDRGSVDGTFGIARRFGAPVRVIERPGASLSDAASAGVGEALGDTVTVVPSRAVLGAGALGAGGDVDLRPVGTTAFGRAAAAMLGPGVHSLALAWPATGARRRPSWYLVAATPAALAAEAFHARPAAWPAAMLAAGVALGLGGRGWRRVALPLAHAGVTAARAVRAGQDPGVAPHRAFLAGEIWDWAAGAGWWAAAAAGRRRQAT